MAFAPYLILARQATVGRAASKMGRFRGEADIIIGVMAQEVALLRPDAVVRDALDDYLRVDYGRLGLETHNSV